MLQWGRKTFAWKPEGRCAATKPLALSRLCRRQWVTWTESMGSRQRAIPASQVGFGPSTRTPLCARTPTPLPASRPSTDAEDVEQVPSTHRHSTRPHERPVLGIWELSCKPSRPGAPLKSLAEPREGGNRSFTVDGSWREHAGAASRGVWDLSSLIRDLTCTPCSGSAES